MTFLHLQTWHHWPECFSCSIYVSLLCLPHLIQITMWLSGAHLNDLGQGQQISSFAAICSLHWSSVAFTGLCHVTQDIYRCQRLGHEHQGEALFLLITPYAISHKAIPVISGFKVSWVYRPLSTFWVFSFSKYCFPLREIPHQGPLLQLESLNF